jgi:hypothetical protein
MQVLSYPLNVEENDGHYILFTIFETPAYEYKSPYTDINVPQQKINSSKLQTYGVSDVKRNRIQEAISKLAGVSYANNAINNNDFDAGRYAKRYRTSILGAGRGAAAKPKNARAAISLYTPQQVKVSHKMNYQAEDVSFAGGAIAGFLDTLNADNKLAAAGFDDAQIKDIIAGIGDIKLGDIYNFGGDVKIFVDADGNVEVEVPDDIEDPGELSSETDNINQAADQGLRVNIQGDQTANFSLFDYGSSKLTSEGENEADTEDDKIIDYLLNGQDYSETIVGQSSNTGPNSNFDNSTNESDKLDINRANSLADYVFDDIQKGLDDANAEYTVSGKTITLADGTTYTQNVEAGQNPESLTQIEKTDTTATQSAIRVGEVETTEPPTNVVLVDFDPVADPGATSGAPFTAPSVSEFGTLIREAQLAVIMALIKPDLSLFPYLNDNKENTPLGGYTQSSFTKIKDNESLPKEIRDLAQAVVNARKKPDSFTSKIANILGVELSQRAKAQQLAPGSAGVGQQAVDFKPIKESLHLFYEMLNEQSAIDQFLDSSNINKNAGQILAYLGSMYASKDNKQIGIVDAEKLPSNIKSQLTKSGFKATSVGRDKGIYVFMDDRTSTPTPDPQPAGVPDDVSQPIPLSIEKDSKIFISPKDTPEFPKEFYNTKFYKDANKDGWMFVNRKDKDFLPKGTKVKTFSIDMNKIEKTDYKKVKNTLE